MAKVHVNILHSALSLYTFNKLMNFKDYLYTNHLRQHNSQSAFAPELSTTFFHVS